jgi:cell division protein FtsW
MGLVVGVMVMAAGLSYRYVLGLLALTLPLGYLVLISAPYRIRRLTAFWCPECDPLGDGFHLLQSLIAVGSGGLLGRGLMGGVQKLFYLPEPYNDFIYAVIAEELGLLGASLVLVCFCVIAWRGLRASVTAPDRFGAFLALGITTMVVAQALLNISVVLGLAPTKGIPLPLVSSGGSSLLVNLASIGVLLNISQHAVSESSAVEPGAA